MSSRDEQVNHAQLLEGYEEAMSRLYKVYAASFSDHRQTWQKLAGDEIDHADWMRALRARIEDGSVRMRAERMVSPGQILDALSRAGSEFDRADQGNISLAEAFRTAMRLEHEMLENGWFTVFDTDSAELKRVFQSLADETRKHLATLEGLSQDAAPPPKGG